MIDAEGLPETALTARDHAAELLDALLIAGLLRTGSRARVCGQEAQERGKLKFFVKLSRS